MTTGLISFKSGSIVNRCRLTRSTIGLLIVSSFPNCPEERQLTLCENSYRRRFERKQECLTRSTYSPPDHLCKKSNSCSSWRTVRLHGESHEHRHCHAHALG